MKDFYRVYFRSKYPMLQTIMKLKINSNTLVNIDSFVKILILALDEKLSEKLYTQYILSFHCKCNEEHIYDYQTREYETTSNEEVCCICYEPFLSKQSIAEFSCKHYIHSSCLHLLETNNSNGKCPLCRKKSSKCKYCLDSKRIKTYIYNRYFHNLINKLICIENIHFIDYKKEIIVYLNDNSYHDIFTENLLIFL